jgi:hypothetical protein
MCVAITENRLLYAAVDTSWQVRVGCPGIDESGTEAIRTDRCFTYKTQFRNGNLVVWPRGSQWQPSDETRMKRGIMPTEGQSPTVSRETDGKDGSVDVGPIFEQVRQDGGFAKRTWGHTKYSIGLLRIKQIRLTVMTAHATAHRRITLKLIPKADVILKPTPSYGAALRVGLLIGAPAIVTPSSTTVFLATPNPLEALRLRNVEDVIEVSTA